MSENKRKAKPVNNDDKNTKIDAGQCHINKMPKFTHDHDQDGDNGAVAGQNSRNDTEMMAYPRAPFLMHHDDAPAEPAGSVAGQDNRNDTEMMASSIWAHDDDAPAGPVDATVAGIERPAGPAALPGEPGLLPTSSATAQEMVQHAIDCRWPSLNIGAIARINGSRWEAELKNKAAMLYDGEGFIFLEESQLQVKLKTPLQGRKAIPRGRPR